MQRQPVTESMLQRQLAAGAASLRFEASLEGLFQDHFDAVDSGSRVMLLILGMVLIGATPLYDGRLLGAPAGFRDITHVIQLGLMVPSLMLALAVVRWASHPRLISGAVITASLVCALGLVAQRVLGAQYGFSVPNTFPAFVLAATFYLGHIRFFSYLPWAVLVVVITCVAEIYAYGANGEAIYDCIAVVMLATIGSTGGYLIERITRERWLREQLLEVHSSLDALTGLANRRQFDDMRMRLARQAAREGRSLAVLMLDIDHFKPFNDHYGHQAGDDCLRAIGQWLGRFGRRPLDLRARIGGEEFCVIWYDLSADHAKDLAARLRAGVAGLNITHDHSPTADVVTASAGLVVDRPRREQDIDAIIQRADQCLYRAKEAGRDRLEIEATGA